MRKVLCKLLVLVLCLTSACPAMGEVELLPPIKQWDMTQPIELEIAADVKTHMPFNDDRLAQLTALLKHLSLKMRWQSLGDEAWSSIGVMVDGDEVMSMAQRQTSALTEVQLSALPESVYTFPAGEENALADLLGEESQSANLFGLDGTQQVWLNDAYSMFTAMPELLEDYKKESTVKTAIKDMGTARTKQVYAVPKDETDRMTKAMLDSCPEGKLYTLLSSLTLSGKQVLTLWLNGEGEILRVEYEGKAGTDEKHLRKVDLTWRLCRKDDEIRDNITLKTPAVRGTDRNSVTYVRDLVEKKNGQVDYDSEFKYEWVLNKKKTVLSGQVDVSSKPEKDGYRLTGDVMVKQQLPDEDSTQRIELVPDVFVGAAQDDATLPQAKGKVTVSAYMGKKLKEQAVLNVALYSGEHFDWVLQQNAINVAGLDQDEKHALRNYVLRALSAELIPHLALLPAEDVVFLSADLPEKTWNQIVEAAHQALQKEELP